MRRPRPLAADMKRIDPPLYLAVGHGDPLMLAQMLDPRLGHEALDAARRIGSVLEQFPEISAVALAYAAHVLHGGDEFCHS